MRKEEKGNKQMRFYVSKHHDAQAGIHTHTHMHTFLSKIYRTRKYLHESNEDKSEKRNLFN